MWLSTSRDVRYIGSQITTDNIIFETVKEFIYLGTIVNTKNNINLDIKCRITLVNRCYYDRNGQLSNKDLTCATKLILCKAVTLPVLFYVAEQWTLLSTDASALRVFERKAIRKIFDSMRVGNDFRIRYNSEIIELLNDMVVVQRFNIQQLRWLRSRRSLVGNVLAY